jgi:DNA modification methylase
VSESFLNGRVQLYRGDCLAVLPTLEECSVDACVTDPPYHLQSVVKRYGKDDLNGPGTVAKRARAGADGYARFAKGFMGKQWDGGDIAFNPLVWRNVFRVLKPGSHLLAFSGTRTYHRMAMAIDAAGFEIRDAIMWHYGSGFPKSHDISKAIDRMAGAEREYIEIGSDGAKRKPRAMAPGGAIREAVQTQSNPVTPDALQWQGWGTALKPATEIICLARKPLSESSIASNVLKHGTGAINVDGCRVATDELKGKVYNNSGDNLSWGGTYGKGVVEGNSQGRWPANLIHDGSEEVVRGFPETTSNPGTYQNVGAGGSFGSPRPIGAITSNGDSGSAARFFYTAKADQEDRLGSKHPTVKPLDLMQYLIRLVTPLGGIVCDPFAGTGTSGEAAWREGFRSILIEREPEYQADIVKRMGLCLAGPDERRAKSVKQVGLEDTPLFGGVV